MQPVMDPVEQTVVNKAEDLATLAAERAVRLSIGGTDRAADLAAAAAEKATKIAVERAIKDRDVEHTLSLHSDQLKAINGSQKRMAVSLTALEGTLERQTVASETVAVYMEKQDNRKFTAWQIRVLVAGVIGSYGGIVALLLTTGH
jgi:uncharacterized protein YbjT (DUF2867 family)